MKRAIVTFLMLAMLCSLFGATAISAAAVGSPAVIVSSTEGKVGDKVEVTVSLEDNPGIAAMMLTYRYDDTALKFISAAANEDLLGGMWYVSKDRPNAVYANMINNNGEDFKKDGVVLTITFEILEGAKPENEVKVICEAGNWSLKKVGFTSVPGKISLEAPPAKNCTITYDANGGKGAPPLATVTAGSEVTISAAKPEYTGFKFLGWAETKDGAVKYKAGDKLTLNEDLTLYAVWKKEASGSVIPGDVDGSGKVNMMDVMMMLCRACGEELPDFVEEAGDIDGDGQVASMMDVMLVLKLACDEPIDEYIK